MFPDFSIPKGKYEQEKWCKEILEGIEKYYSAYYGAYRKKDFENFNLFNGIFDQTQFEYVTDTSAGTNPARLVDFPLMKHLIDLLVGEFLAEPIKFTVEIVNRDAVYRKFEKKVGIVSEALLRPYMQELEKILGFKPKEEQYGIAIPDNIDEFIKMNYRENVEDVVYNGMAYLINRYDIEDTFKRGLYDLCITGKEFYRIEIVGNDPIPRRVDPRNLIYDIDIDKEDLSTAEFIAEQRFMTVSEIIAAYREDLDKEQIQKLGELKNTSLTTLQSNYPEFGSIDNWYRFNNATLTHIRVVTAEWKAHKTIRVKVSENKYDKDSPFIHILPDNYKAKKGDNIEHREIVEVWEATRIGHEIFIRMRPSPFNTRREDNGFGDAQMSYYGVIHYNIDGKPYSLMDSMKQIAILYNLTMYNIELVMARSGGKSVVYDVSQVPEGYSPEDVIYHAKNHGFIFINSAQEGGQVRAGFNQFQQVDFTMSNALTQLVNLKMVLEDTISKLTGINPARAGMTASSAAVGTTERQVAQSGMITQPLFYIHSKCMEKVMTKVSDMMKIAWAGRKEYTFTLGETGAAFINLMREEDISLSDYSIFIKNTFKETKMKQQIIGLSEAALRGGSITFLDLVKILNADTSKEAEKILEKSIEATKALNAQIRAQEAQQQQMAIQAQMQNEQVKQQVNREGHQAKVKAAEVAAQGKMEAERIEQRGKKDYEDHRFVRDIDRMAFQETMNPDPTLIELSMDKLK